MRSIFLFVLSGLFFLPFYIKAHAVYSPVEVVLNTGDTLRGYVAELGESKRYDRCLFRLSPKAELQVLKYQDRLFLETTEGDRQEAPARQNQKADSRAEKYRAGLFAAYLFECSQEEPSIFGGRAVE